MVDIANKKQYIYSTLLCASALEHALIKGGLTEPWMTGTAAGNVDDERHLADQGAMS